jgi:long-chain acyl-CoA synthetase
MASPDFGPNLVTMFHRSAGKGKERPFLHAKRDGAWQSWSWRRVAGEVDLLARAFRSLGLSRGDRVYMVAESRPEWPIADLAIMQAGGVTVPGYTTNTPADHAYILDHCEARAVVVSGPALLQKLLPALRQSQRVRFVVAFDPPPADHGLAMPVLSHAEALAEGGRAAEGEDVAATLGKDDLACFIYTSGTGGRPKGVMLSHGNILANMTGAWHLLHAIGLDDEVFLSFLPLSHSYEHTAGQFFPMAIGAQIYYAEGIETLSANLVETRPTILTCVPRLYEVMRQRISQAVLRQGGFKAKLFHKALSIGRKRYESPESLGLAERLLDPLLERLVRDKIRARFGGRLKAMVSGGAPLNYDVGLFFTALGLPLLQGYGQTESSPVISANPPGRTRLETVGPPLDGVEVRIAPDGEILVRGDLVMQGYWKDEAATREVLKDGWLHTGDVGVLDPDGYLRITDRKKDIIVNSGGDNLAPQRVEGILALEPEIGQAVVYGDRRPHLVALVVPDLDFAARYAGVDRRRVDLAALSADPAFQAAIGEAVKRANRDLSVIERVRRFHVMGEAFGIDNGLMTPTMKLRRHAIYARHRELLEGLYGHAPAPESAKV